MQAMSCTTLTRMHCHTMDISMYPVTADMQATDLFSVWSLHCVRERHLQGERQAVVPLRNLRYNSNPQ